MVSIGSRLLLEDRRRSRKSKPNHRHGKPEAYRHVLRPSRESHMLPRSEPHRRRIAFPLQRSDCDNDFVLSSCGLRLFRRLGKASSLLFFRTRRTRRPFRAGRSRIARHFRKRFQYLRSLIGCQVFYLHTVSLKHRAQIFFGVGVLIVHVALDVQAAVLDGNRFVPQFNRNRFLEFYLFCLSLGAGKTIHLCVSQTRAGETCQLL